MFLEDMINELRAELDACIFSKTERAAVEAELATLLAQRDAFAKAEPGALKDIALEAG